MAGKHEYRSDPFFRMSVTQDNVKVFWGFVQGARLMGNAESIHDLAVQFTQLFELEEVASTCLRKNYYVMNDIIIDIRKK